MAYQFSSTHNSQPCRFEIRSPFTKTGFKFGKLYPRNTWIEELLVNIVAIDTRIASRFNVYTIMHKIYYQGLAMVMKRQFFLVLKRVVKNEDTIRFEFVSFRCFFWLKSRSWSKHVHDLDVEEVTRHKPITLMTSSTSLAAGDSNAARSRRHLP